MNMLRNSKYQTEFRINMFGNLCIVIQQDGLARLEKQGFDENNPCHIYMIARRPRIMIDAGTVRIEDEFITGQFLIQNGKELISKRFIFRNFLGDNLRFHCPFPHNEYFFYNEGGHLISSGKAALLLQKNESAEYLEYLSLEILYIGQSYGVDGIRSAPQRLQNHSTLQEIYSEAIRRTPDKEIWLVLWSFTPLVVAAIDGRSHTFEMTDEEDNLHIQRVSSEFMSEQQQINFTEAALIKYFEPEYNKIFKNTFPNPAHQTYSECYDLDIHSVSVELQTDEVYCQLYSPSIAPSWDHLPTFSLRDRNERKSLLDAALPDNENRL